MPIIQKISLNNLSSYVKGIVCVNVIHLRKVAQLSHRGMLSYIYYIMFRILNTSHLHRTLLTAKIDK